MSRTKIAVSASLLVIGLAIALPVFGEKKPQSLLPPGFSQSPTAVPDSEPKAPKSTNGDSGSSDLLDDLKLNTPDQKNTTAAKKDDSARFSGMDALGNAVAAVDEGDAIPAESYDLAPELRRSLAQVGLLAPNAGGFGEHAFGATRGPALESVMRKTAAPIASRWVSILLRRALLSDALTPSHVNGADWTAERAWLLLRMGEADSARMLIQRVDQDNYTPKLYAVAMQSALANADLASFCPIVPKATELSDEPSWSFARAICASLSGESGSASSYLREAQSDSGIRGIDSQLAERVIGAGKNTRHAVVIEWGDVSWLTTWRFGMASAVGLAIPSNLYANARPNVRAWAARAPMLKASDRVDAADWAAALGVFSNQALVDFYSSLADDVDAIRNDNSPQGLLRTAYVGESIAARTAACQALWNAPNIDPVHQYARLILTARAAIRIPVDDDLKKYSDTLTASMMTAGLDIQAQRWSKIANEGSDEVARRTWGLLAVGAPTRVVDISDRQISAYRSTGELRSRFLVAALAGLGRISPGDAGRLANDYNVAIGHKSAWSQAIDAAAARGEAGTVAVLAAAGMQSLNWSQIPAEHLFHIISALKRVGLEPEARMVAAEALTRA